MCHSFGIYHLRYWSPIPSEFEKHRVLHFCDFCLNFFGTQKELSRHLRICSLSHPPGNEIYRSEGTFHFLNTCWALDGSFSVVDLFRLISQMIHSWIFKENLLFFLSGKDIYRILVHLKKILLLLVKTVWSF